MTKNNKTKKTTRDVDREGKKTLLRRGEHKTRKR